MTKVDQPLRVLIIDDDPDIHADFRKCLANREATRLNTLERSLFPAAKLAASAPEASYALDFAHQGQEGYKQVSDLIRTEGASPYTAIFVDMRMPPGWDGLKTLGALWTLDSTLPLIICTAYSDYSRDEIDRRFGQGDPLVYLAKPFDGPTVRQLVSYFAKKRGVLRAG